MNSNSLLVASSGCSVYSIALFANSGHFTSFFPIWVPFIYLGFPRGSAGEESTCNAWETWVQYLGWEDPLEAHEKMLNFSNPQGNGYHFTPFRMAIIKKEKKKEIAVFLVLAWSSHSSTAFDPKAPNHPPHSPHTSAGHAGALWPWGGGRRWSIHEDWGLLGRWCEPDFSQTSLGWGAWGIQGTRVLIIP